MKKKKLMVLLVSIGLILAFVLSGCAAPEAEVVEKTVTKTVTETQTVEVDRTYRCLNPKGEFIPVELHPIAPRLDIFDGKTVLLYASEANPVIFPVLGPLMEETYPNTTFEYIWTERWGDDTPSEEALARYDAVIHGISW